MSHTHRILLVDAYDSFTNNLCALLQRVTGAEVHTVSIDTFNISQLQPHLSSFDAIVVGPGPGSPYNDVDVGIIKSLWALDEAHLLPIFGVCLGFQSLCLHHGAPVRKLATVKHGQKSVIQHNDSDIFKGAGLISAVRYHSLYVDLPGEDSTALTSNLQFLAHADDKEENGKVPMAVRHRAKPFWAVQYHPESICTEGGSDVVIQNFWNSAMEWSNSRSRVVMPLASTWKLTPRPRSLLQSIHERNDPTMLDTEAKISVQKTSFFAPYLSVTRICELLGVLTSQEFILLESAASPGRFSIINILMPGRTDLIQYKIGQDHASIGKVGAKDARIPVDLRAHPGSSIWKFIADYMSSRKAEHGDEQLPFWGGLVGYIDYEVGVSALSVQPKMSEAATQRSNISLVFVERSIVYDSQTQRVHIQSLLKNDSQWLESTKSLLQQEAQMSLTPSATPPLNSQRLNGPRQTLLSTSTTLESKIQSLVVKPDMDTYIQKVKDCQAKLLVGESYELCLTAPTKVHIPKNQLTPWQYYLRLRSKNPAPYAAYVSLPGINIVGSSPERFLSWSRNGHCQLRPIKGTVRKISKSGDIVTREEAEAVLNTPKEMAENLMIVDLIRHDLSGIAEEGSVRVPKLMEIEEYETVYQLVSVIEGDLSQRQREEEGFTGFDVLAKSLPPGSMTGAPKKRSVELLQEIETCERGAYSGVIGYFSVCGAGDWSVVIRTAFKYDTDVENINNDETECWTIGAGGAITALSSPEEEWEEMLTKLNSTVGTFTF